jgi:DNA (cytosine-5)-methyltransferase 1
MERNDTEHDTQLALGLARPHRLTISAIMSLLERHIGAKYDTAGASRLPALAVYAVYQCIVPQFSRYSGKTLCLLKNRNASEAQSGRIGDIDVISDTGSAFEGVKVKHGVKITEAHVWDAYELFKSHKTDRYYFLTTANMDGADWDGINERIARIRRCHGCEVIVDDVYDTIKHYLQFLTDPSEFVRYYVDAMDGDKAIKPQHKTMWNDLVKGG